MTFELRERRVAVPRRRFPNRRYAIDRRLGERRLHSAAVTTEWRYGPDPRAEPRRVARDRRTWIERRAAAPD